MSTWNEDVAAFAAVVARMAPNASPHIVGRAVALLLVAAKGIDRAAVMECNGCGARYGESNERFSARQAEWEKATKRTRKTAICKFNSAIGLLGIDATAFEFGGDPRGFTMKIKKEFIGGESNSFGGEFYGVPVRAA